MENPAYLENLGELEGPPKKCSKSDFSGDREQVFTYEQAIALVESGKFHYFLELICGLTCMIVSFEGMGIGIILPFMQKDLQATISEQGYLASAGFLGTFLNWLPIGFLSDTWGRVKVLRMALFFSIITSVISAFSVHIWMLIVMRFINGLVLAGINACVCSYMGEFHGNKTRALYILLLMAFQPLACIYLPGLGLAILPLELNATVFGMNFGSWRLLLLTHCAFSILVFLGWCVIPESPKLLLILGESEKSLEVLREIFSWNTGKSKNEYPVQKVDAEITGGSLSNVSSLREATTLIWKQTVAIFQMGNIFHIVNMGFLCFAVRAVACGMFIWHITILTELNRKTGSGYTICEVMSLAGYNSSNVTDESQIFADVRLYTMILIIGVIFAVICVAFAFSIKFVAKKSLLVVWIAICGLTSFIVHWVVPSIGVSIFILRIMISLGNCGTILYSIAIDYFPANINAIALCLLVTIGNLGGIAGSNFIGLTIYWHCDFLFFMLSGIMVVLVVSSVFLPNVHTTAKLKINKQINIQT